MGAVPLLAWGFGFARAVLGGHRAVVELPGRRVGVQRRCSATSTSYHLPVWALMTWMVVLGTILPFFLLVSALRHLPATRVAIIAMLEPVVATVVAWAWLGESLRRCSWPARWSCWRDRARPDRPLEPDRLCQIVKMGRSAYWTGAPKAVSFLRTGRIGSAVRPGLEPQRAIEKARRTDPPSDGLSHFSGGRRAPIHSIAMVQKVLLASPRGYCAGVERAVETVEKALELYGPPVYVRKQIVHNLHVVRELEARGAIFVDDENEVPEGKTVVFSAHGVAPSVLANSAARSLHTIDATCPLVTKVHSRRGGTRPTATP